MQWLTGMCSGIQACAAVPNCTLACSELTEVLRLTDKVLPPSEPTPQAPQSVLSYVFCVSKCPKPKNIIVKMFDSLHFWIYFDLLTHSHKDLVTPKPYTSTPRDFLAKASDTSL